VVQVEADPVGVERAGGVDVGDGETDDLQLEVHAELLPG